MSRTQSILALLLAVQVVLLLLIAAPWSSGSASPTAATLLPELQSFAPTKIEISGGDDQTIDLERVDDAWTIEQAGGYPADTTKIDGLLDKLENLEVRRPVVRSSRYHEALGVTPKQHERELRIWDGESDTPRVELFVGKSSNYGINNVRRADRDEVFEVAGLSPWDMRPEAVSWIQTQLVDVQPDQIRSLTLTNRHGTFELSRDEAGTWSVTKGQAPGAQLDDASVESFVRSMGSMRLSEPAGRVGGDKPFGLDDPAARLDLVYQPQEGQSGAFELSVGAEVDANSGKRYARVAGSDFAVVLSKFDADKILDKKLADLVPKQDGAKDAG